MLQGLLEGADFVVEQAANGLEALSAMRADPPRIVVTDLEMPELNGLELVAAINAEFPNIPVILSTAVGSEMIAAAALKHGAASYVPKSTIEDLVPTIQRIIAISEGGNGSPRLMSCVTLQEVNFELPNEEELISPLVAYLQNIAQRFGLGDSVTLMRMATALDEALHNALIHGNLEVSSDLRKIGEGEQYFELAQVRRKQAPYCDRKVYLTAIAKQEEMTFIIRDQGPGFNVQSIPDPTSPELLEAPSGRGLWLINAFMDDVRHNSQGNEITMKLRRRSPDEEENDDAPNPWAAELGDLSDLINE
jgi:CheY-like chemotaxis protein